MSAEKNIVNIADNQFKSLLDQVELLKETLLENSEKLSLDTVDLAFQDEALKVITDHINSNRTGIFESLESVTQNVIATVKSMTKSSKTLDEIHSESSQLADYSSTIASAGEELSATINSISLNIQNTVTASGEAKVLAQNGDAEIVNTLEKITKVSDVLTHTTKSLSRLKETAEQANTIVRVVNDISAKTDLLALNASIEAARAGAAGKGFAVVAHEVGRLSEKTQASISEIESILKNIQRDVDAVSNDLNVGTESANEALTKVNDAKKTINHIVTKIEYVDNEVSNIGAAVKEQGEAVTDIASNVSTISNGSKEVNHKVVRLADILDGVTKGSNGTRTLLGSFNLGRKSLLLQSQVDHLFWMHRLRRMIEGKEVIHQDEFVDHTKCRLGKWYIAIKDEARNKAFEALYQRLDAPHAKLHKIAANVIRLFNSDDQDEAFKKYEECLPISDDIVDLLESMMDEINE